MTVEKKEELIDSRANAEAPAGYYGRGGYVGS